MSGSEVLVHDEWFAGASPGNVAFGERSYLWSSYAFLCYRSERPCGLRVGDDTGLYAGTMFNLGPAGEVEIGDFCTLVGAIVSSNARIVIGDHALVSFDTVIADSFDEVPPRALDREDARAELASGPGVEVGANAWVGARAVLLGGARIGSDAIVGAATVVDFEVPPGAIVAGNPARVVGAAASAR